MDYQKIDENTLLITQLMEKYNPESNIWDFNNRNELSDFELDNQIELSWNLSLNLALKDDYLSLEEKENLDNIKNMAVLLKNPTFREMLKYKLDTSYLSVQSFEKNKELESNNTDNKYNNYPKLKPEFFDDKDKKKDKDKK